MTARRPDLAPTASRIFGSAAKADLISLFTSLSPPGIAQASMRSIVRHSRPAARTTVRRDCVRTIIRTITVRLCLIPTVTTSKPSATRRRDCTRPCRFHLMLEFALPLPERPQPQRVEPDEAFGVHLVVGDLAVLECHQIPVVQRIFAVAADHADIALVELEPHPAGDELLALVDCDLQHLALGREPEAVIDQLGVFRHQLVLEMGGAAIERDRFDATMGGEQDSAARRLIHTARLHADEAVLDEIEPTDALLAAERVELRQQRRGRKVLAVERERIA